MTRRNGNVAGNSAGQQWGGGEDSRKIGSINAAMNHTPESLIAFEDRVKLAFLAKQIRAPVHLSRGNEKQLISIFRDIQPTDFVCSNWRSHYHGLLKGIPEDALFDMICSGRSMYVMSKPHRFLASSIVGGMLPIALGLAMGIKRRGGNERVWVFLGDMTARSGIYHEFVQYAKAHDLPVSTVVEDNGLSTDTPTAAVWGESSRFVCTHCYRYERQTPHVGVGSHVDF